MPLQVLSLDKTVAKYQSRVAIAGPEYADGVENPRRDWLQAALAAATSWAAAMAEAIANKSWEAGLRKAGTEKWQRRTLELGLARWSPGVQAGIGDYRSGIEPYLAELGRLDLPPRREKGHPDNYRRSSLVGQALRKVKLALAK